MSSEVVEDSSSGPAEGLSAKWLEAVLERHYRETSVERVLSVKKEQVVSKGDNYASDICRIVMDCLLGNGDSVTRSLIVKSVPETEHRAKLITEWGIFKREITVLSEIVPKMEEILEEAGIHDGALSTRCVYFKPYDLLVLQDLKEEGFKMGNRFVGMGKHEAALALEELAKFHAASVVMKKKSMFDPDDYTYALLDNNVDMIQIFHNTCFTKLADVIETYWPPEWKSYADSMKDHIENSLEKWKKVMIIDENEFNVLNHGDYWLNNMMFKYHPSDKKPTEVRMIDFQMCFYNSFAFDWLYFTNSSLEYSVRKDHYGWLLQIYHKALTRYMTKLGLEAPSFEQLEQEIKRKAIFGLYIATFMMPVMKTDPEDVMDIEEVLKKASNKEELDVNTKQYLGKSFTETLQLLLPMYRELGVI